MLLPDRRGEPVVVIRGGGVHPTTLDSTYPGSKSFVPDSVRDLYEPEMVELGEAVLEGTRAINDEDVAINRRTAEGLQSRFAEPGPLSALEAACWHFRRWLLPAVSD